MGSLARTDKVALSPTFPAYVLQLSVLNLTEDVEGLIPSNLTVLLSVALLSS